MSLPISGFTAVPNPQMLAFMAAQSFVMMMQAGEGWQYGKRKQSAMTNEEFNQQTPLSIMQRQMSELKSAIPTIEKSMNAMTPMIRTIVIQYGEFMKEIISSLPAALSAAQGGQTLHGNISTVAQEFAEIFKNLIPKIPEAEASAGDSTLTSHDTPNDLITIEDPHFDKDWKHSLYDISSASARILGIWLRDNNYNTSEERRQIFDQLNKLERAIPEKLPDASKVKATTEQQEYNIWAAKLTSLQNKFLQGKNNAPSVIPNYPKGGGPGSQQQAKINYLRPITNAIRAISEDYRNPNNIIRKHVLRLRNELGNGNWIYR